MARLLEERKVATADLGALLAKARTASATIVERTDLRYCELPCNICMVSYKPQPKNNE